MIQILHAIGKQVRKNIPYAQLPSNRTVQLLVLNVANKSILSGKMDPQKVRRYAWVGNRTGQEPKDRLIVKDDAVKYLIHTTPFLLLSRLETLDHPQKASFIRRLENLIRTLGTLDLRDPSGKTLHILRVDRLLDPQQQQTFLENLRQRVEEDTGIPSSPTLDLETALQTWSSQCTHPKDFAKAYADAFYTTIRVYQSIPKNGMVIWTFEDAQGILVEDPVYHAYVAETFKPELEEAEEGVCHLCNRRGKVTAKTSAFKFFKFFNEDKVGFAPMLNKRRFPSALGLCATCYENVLYGDRFVLDHLNTRFLGMDVVLFPHPVPEKRDLQRIAEVLKKRLNATATVDQWHAFQEKLKDNVFSNDWEYVRSQLFITLMFIERSRNAVKVLRVIQEVPPSRLDELDETRRRVEEQALHYFVDVGKKKSLWDLDLQTQYTLLPAYKDTRTPPLFLSYLEALLLRQPFPRPAIVRHFLAVARAHARGQTQTFRGVPPRTVEQFMVQTLVFQTYAQLVGIFPTIPIVGGDSMVLEHVPKHLAQYVAEHVPPGRAQGLFLLGYVIGLIGKAQQEGMPRSEKKSPPILNAVPFGGMDEARVQRLVNQVADRMRHYLKGWAYDEGERVLSAALQLLEQKPASLPSYEQTYWVLAGYGFARLGRVNKGEQKGGEE